MDLAKVTPGDWHLGMGGSHWLILDNQIVIDSEGRVGSCWKKDDAEFVALSKRAFNVMERRHFEPEWRGNGWGVDCADFQLPEPLYSQMMWPDPYTALVEAEKWYIQNVEA